MEGGSERRGTKHGNYGDKISSLLRGGGGSAAHIELSGRLIHARDLRHPPDCCLELNVMSNLPLHIKRDLSKIECALQSISLLQRMWATM